MHSKLTKMEQTWFYAIVLTFLGLIWFFILSKPSHKHQPPSPPSLPIIGHLHLLNTNQPFHRSLHELSSKYGPIYSLKLGHVRAVVISCSSLVEECFTKNDIVLANRPNNRSSIHFHYNQTTLGSAPYGSHWRNLRRITASEFFSTTRLNLLTHIREEEITSLIKGLLISNNNANIHDYLFTPVQIRPKLFQCFFNIIMRMLTGKRYDFVEGIDKGLYEVVNELLELGGASNPIDFFPFLRWFNYGNIEGRMKNVMTKMEEFFDGVLEECNKFRKDESFCKFGDKMPLIYKLFDLQEENPEQYSDQIIKGIILIMLMGGIDTAVVTIEWALASLLNNQNILNEAQLEIDSRIGRDRLVDESDLEKLAFIQNIINETLRLFPAGPLLVPHASSEDCTIAGYQVPKGTMVLINAWTIHRDPNLWDDPLDFNPKRFEGGKVNEYRTCFIPFGVGRRSCPGSSLANRAMTIILASLLQCFDWETNGGVNVELIEGFGLAMPMATPLVAMCKPRQDIVNVVLNI
ncbi:cytochrome P450 81Q32-like isoform X2 [Silene latifolia]|uniref:cytochrome P450 81Q32-like isoform X2 n=1 Tax=Silene latifolia TaxID=37657 RepID=UPI003D7884F2